jgi:outer membrane protein assembly factor BamB
MPRLALIALMLGLTVAGCGNNKPVTAAAKPLATSSATATAKTSIPNSGPLVNRGRDWSTLLHSASHYGAALAAGPRTATLRWQRNLGGAISAGPVTAGAVAYVASSTGVLHAIDVRTGKDSWTFNGGGTYGYEDLSTSASVLANGEILWPGPHDHLFALTPQGHLLWTVTVSGTPLTPVVDPAQHLLVLATSTGVLSGYRLGAGASQPKALWSHTLAKASFGNPALAANGTTYETAGDSLFAVTSTGHILWQVQTSDQVEVSAAVTTDGTITFNSDNRYEFGIAPDGTILWRYPMYSLSYSSPITLTGNQVLDGDSSGVVFALKGATGQRIAKVQANGSLWTSVAVDSRGDMYFATRTGLIDGFSATGTKLFALQTSTKFDSYPAIAADGTLLVGGGDGILRAFG